MEKSGNTKAEQVRSARKWLERAEQSFDSRSDIRGELNLMLAEAEMKNLRKNHGAGLRPKGKIALAAGLILAGAGLWLAVTEQSGGSAVPPLTAKRISVEAPFEQAAAEQTGTGAAPPGQDAAVSLPYGEDTGIDNSLSQPDAADTVQDDVPAVSAEQRVPPAVQVLTEAQIQRAVQDARHSLRGTETMIR